MLLELHIQNFAIIESLSLAFSQGMTVLTGETGAGKSIIIDALGLVAGGRGSSEFVRSGKKKCVLEAHFQMGKQENLQEILGKYEIDHDQDVITIQRDIHANGRNVCRVNGSIVNISALKEISAFLIDIHGQNEHQELMKTDNHQFMLDRFGGDDLKTSLANYQKTYEAYRKVKKQYDNWQSDEQETNRRLDLLSFQVEELNKAELYPNEERELEEEAGRLQNFQKIMQALQTAYKAIQDSEASALESTGLAMNQLDTISSIGDQYQKLSDTLSEGYYQLQEVASDIYDELDSLEYDEDRLNQIQSRLDFIQQLKRKYGNSISEIMAYHRQAEIELKQLENREFEIGSLETKLSKLSQSLESEAVSLSKIRRRVAIQLEEAIHDQLKALYMDKVEFKVKFKRDLDDISPSIAGAGGMDSIEFFVATNPGEPLKPLTKVASGGELSRLMLALKSIFSKTKGITSIIFDEVDTGVSGRVAQAIADKIYAVSINSQVLCISHLPQVAAMADSHLYISKKVEGKETKTGARLLGDQEKTEEIGRMMAGLEVTEKTLEAARELKGFAEKEKIKMRP